MTDGTIIDATRNSHRQTGTVIARSNHLTITMLLPKQATITYLEQLRPQSDAVAAACVILDCQCPFPGDAETMFGIRPIYSNRALTVSIVFFACGFLCSCASPEAQLKERQANMAKFVKGAVRHMLDRNPDTIQDSMNELTRNELTQPLVERLQNERILPETDLSILKIKDDALKNHATNQVVLNEVQPLDPASKPDVRFRVTGKDVAQIDGKPHGEKPFDYIATCRLTDDMDGFPRITELVGAAPRPAESEARPGKKKSGRHHQSI
jgi:hypothetical protein